MKRTAKPTRRAFLGTVGAASVSAAVAACAPARDPEGGSGSGGDSEAANCNPTASNAMGPFHREQAPVRNQLNVDDEEGDRLVITGFVTGLDCPDPVSVADLDVWHCNVQGNYDNDGDGFAFRGRTSSDERGLYRIETLLPGRYRENDQFRPRHVHFMVSAAGYEELVTQLYFEDDEFNDIDPEFDPSLARPLVDDGAGGWTVQFDIVLRDA